MRFPSPLLFLFLLLAVALPACNCANEPPGSNRDSGAPTSCSCPDAQTCDPVTTACVAALGEGAWCEKTPDGGVVEGACVVGLSCGLVGTDKRCAKDCTAQTEVAVCGATRRCLARHSGSASGYCATSSTEGGECDDTQLKKCSSSTLICLSPSGSTAGHCYRYCDLSLAEPNPVCAVGASCSDLFPGEAEGVCVVPVGHSPAACDYSTMKFCAKGEVCARFSYSSPLGFCHKRCSQPGDCTSPQECAEPSTGLSICVDPVARCTAYDPAACAACLPELDRYCGPADICVELPGADGGSLTVCKQDCSPADGGSPGCTSGICQPLQGTTRSVCL